MQVNPDAIREATSCPNVNFYLGLLGCIDRAITVLHVFHHFPAEHIAFVCGVTKLEVYQQLDQARATLKDSWDRSGRRRAEEELKQQQWSLRREIRARQLLEDRKQRELVSQQNREREREKMIDRILFLKHRGKNMENVQIENNVPFQAAPAPTAFDTVVEALNIPIEDNIPMPEARGRQKSVERLLAERMNPGQSVLVVAEAAKRICAKSIGRAVGKTFAMRKDDETGKMRVWCTGFRPDGSETEAKNAPATAVAASTPSPF